MGLVHNDGEIRNVFVALHLEFISDTLRRLTHWGQGLVVVLATAPAGDSFRQVVSTRHEIWKTHQRLTEVPHICSERSG